MIDTPETQTKGRIIIVLKSEQQPYISPFSGFGFQHGLDASCNLEVNADGLEEWRRKATLPEGYTLLRVYYGLNTHMWRLVLESERIPLVYKNLPIEEAAPTVEIVPGDDEPYYLHGRTIRITHIALPECTDDKYSRPDGLVRCLMASGEESYVPADEAYNRLEKGEIRQIRPRPPKSVLENGESK